MQNTNEARASLKGDCTTAEVECWIVTIENKTEHHRLALTLTLYFHNALLALTAV